MATTPGWSARVSVRVPGGSRTRLVCLEGRSLLPLGHGHTISGRRGSRTLKGMLPRPGSSGVPSPVGLPFLLFLKLRRNGLNLHPYSLNPYSLQPLVAAAAGIEPASGRLTAAFPYQHRTHRIDVSPFSQDGWIRTSGLVLPRHAGCQTSPRPESIASERPAGVEPALPPWQGSRLPLHHGRLLAAGLSKIESTGRDSNPRRRITGAESWPLDDQCLSDAESRASRVARTAFKPPTRVGQSAIVGSEGLEPSPAWVRTRDAAANTSIPFVVFQW